MDKIPSGLVSGTAVLAAAIIGAQNGPQRPATAAWYALLRKPAYTPPGPLIGGAWGILELLLSIAGYRLLCAPQASARSAALCAWSLTLLGLAGYPWLFFRRKRLASSAAASSAMLGSAGGMFIAAGEVDEPAAIMTVPLLFWLGFATLLSEDFGAETQIFLVIKSIEGFPVLLTSELVNAKRLELRTGCSADHLTVLT